jgi:carbamoyltransferase
VNILGLSCYYHDAAAVLLRDGGLVAAAEEERFSRKKHDSDFPSLAVDFCLRQGAIRAADLDYVVFYEKPFRKFERLFLSLLGTWPRSGVVFQDSMMSWLGNKLWIKALLQEKFSLPSERILFSEHHLSHAASAFLCSPFQEAAVLTVDGVGEWSTATMGRGHTEGHVNRIDLFSEIRFPHSVGLLYSAFTAFLGFEVNEGEYKVMGMAPYGRPRHVDKVMKLVRVYNDGSIELDLSYFSFHYHRSNTCSKKFFDLFGPARDPRARFVTAMTEKEGGRVDPPASSAEREKNQYYADVAASIQRVTEDIVLAMARHLHAQTGLKKLCLAGGVALNSVANHRLLTESPFDDLYVQPSAGDAGGALGAALYVNNVVLGQPRRLVMDRADWGRSSDEGETMDFFRQTGVPCRVIHDESRLLDEVVGLLTRGQVVGWHQGRFEWGPRALGHRSILADPRRSEMKDVVNRKIKFRESFRPFAPSVTEESASDYFTLPPTAGRLPARLMLVVAPVRSEKQAVIPAVTHVDGTGRLQTVSSETNPRYHALIKRFGQATGVPVVLNTSFNLRGEPIVNSTEDAYKTFMNCEMDVLVVGNTVVAKN